MFYRLMFVVLSLGLLFGCGPENVRSEMRPHEDGTYRGAFIDRDVIQVVVQFTLKDGIVTAASFRRLYLNDRYNQDNEQEPYRSVIQQHQEALDYLVGKNLSQHLAQLYSPGDIVTTEVDGYSGATIRSNKLISAIRDGLNRGVYSH